MEKTAKICNIRNTYSLEQFYNDFNLLSEPPKMGMDTRTEIVQELWNNVEI